MDEEKLENLPRFKKLREEIEGFKSLKPLTTFLKMLGLDGKSLDDSFDELSRISNQMDELSKLPDKFNDLFAEIGWVLNDVMDLEVVKTAIAIAEKESLENADEYLTDYYSPEWVLKTINWLKYLPGFQARFDFAQKAADDYKAGRFYASVHVIISLIDGWVNELNIVNFQRQGFFNENSELVAWDSVAAHPKGLMRLKEVFGKSRLRTREEQIRIPYRHGIVHGMDLGYDNKYVAAKCWAALFAVRDWAIKVRDNELIPPPLEIKQEMSLWESIEHFNNVRAQTEKLKNWKPRELVIGETIPVSGNAEIYQINSPEQKLAEFFNLWINKNFGYMAKCISPMLTIGPKEIRETFGNIELLGFKLKKINERAPFATDALVTLLTPEDGEIEYEIGLVMTDETKQLAFLDSTENVWGILRWGVKSKRVIQPKA